MNKIFSEVADNYWKNGFAIIPVNRMNKQPVPELGSWERFQKELPSEDEQAEMIIKYAACGIAVICGALSGVCAIDIDKDSLIIDPRIPRSPCVRRGAKGEVRFFKYNPRLKNFSIRGNMDFMADNKYIIVPPSLHEKTKSPYEWTGQLRFIDRDSLPELPDDIEEKMRSAFENYDPDSLMIGRNDKYTKMCQAKFHDGKDIDTVSDEMLAHDLEQMNPLFSDIEEHYYKKTKDVRKACRMFVENQHKTFKKHNPENIEVLEAPEDFFAPSAAPILPPVPKSEMLFKLYSTICARNATHNHAIALAGALSTISAVAANRYSFRYGSQVTAPNIYSLIIAPSGTGKNSAIQTAATLLNDYNLLGTMHKSGASFLKGAQDYRQQLQVSDEVSSLLKTFKSKNSSQSELSEFMTGMFSQSNSLFVAPQSIASSKGNQSKSFWNPCISFLGATTPSGFNQNLEGNMASGGFLARFLFFKQQLGDFWTEENRPQDYYDEVKQLIYDFIYNHPINMKASSSVTTTDNERDVRYIEPNDSAKNWIDEKRIQYHTEHIELERNTDQRAEFQARKMELVLKIALIDCVSDHKVFCTVENLEFAESVFDYSFSLFENIVTAAQDYVDPTRNITYGMALDRIERRFKVRSKMDSYYLANTFRTIPSDIRNKVLSNLVEGGLIKVYEEKTATKPKRVYELV